MYFFMNSRMPLLVINFSYEERTLLLVIMNQNF